MTTTKQPTPVNKSRFFSTVLKNWPVLAGLAIVCLLFFTSAIAPLLRGLLLVPMMVLTGYATAIVVRNLFHRQTTDAMADTPGEVQWQWAQLSPFQKILIQRLDIYVIVALSVLLGLAVLVDFKAVIDVLTGQ